MTELQLVKVDKPKTSIYDGPTLDSRQTPELVFAFVGPVGSGVTHTAKIIERKLTETFGYQCRTIKVSDLISQDAEKVSEETVVSGTLERTENLQKIGNRLREKFGPDYLAKRVVEVISDERSPFRIQAESAGQPPPAAARRYATLIDSLKRPEEIRLLRRVYGELLHVFCIFAPEEVRRKRLGSGRFKASDIDKILRWTRMKARSRVKRCATQLKRQTSSLEMISQTTKLFQAQ